MNNSQLKLGLVLFFFLPIFISAQKVESRKVFTTTPTYDEIISTYTALVKGSKIAQFKENGTTDIGKPLHLLVISKDGKFDPSSNSSKTKILINNGIHPGEPDGVDACIELTKAFLAHPEMLPGNVVILIIPIYNVDGCLNRGNISRANQNGPEEYGFRGNSKNLDLNRDFIKCDAQNTISFEKIFQQWKPDVFIDTHVSDGADYQYVMTLIATQRNKLNPIEANFMDKEMVPALYSAMKEKKYDMCPYVESIGETPESGIEGFLETPRFSTGYTSLFNCLSFVTETHMWKPYNDRVWATYEFLLSTINYCSKQNDTIKKLHRDADDFVASEKKYSLNWALDTTQFEWISFRGFEAKHKLSEVSGLQRLYYDRNAPYEKQIKFYNTYSSTANVIAPLMYIIPQSYSKVIERLQLNNVTMKCLKKDTAIKVGVYYINDYKSPNSPYESHYLHSKIKISSDTQLIQYYKGDFVIQVNQSCNRYIVETLEPEGGDSFFAWNFFDGILQQKEWFSDYIFEEQADSILKSNPAIKAQLMTKKISDTTFAKSNWAQLSFIYRNSGYMEKSFDRYPVGRLNQFAKLPLE
ncbi:MAG: M14 family zinc carboxypeptidase [Bacteroidetes bacterium]|jgi:hypothetical protein|nr:M14 family zinc carboxypeptidase [Bacteroidota bacterium]